MGTLAATLAGALVVVAPAVAQGSPEDLVGPYPLSVDKVSGAGCSVDEAGSFAVTSVGPGTIALSLNGTAASAPFNAAQRTFRTTIAADGAQVRLSGAFERHAEEVAVSLDLAFMGCVVRLAGAKSAPPLEAAAPPAAAQAAEATDAETAETLNKMSQALAEREDEQKWKERRELTEPIEEGDTSNGSFEEMLAEAAQTGPFAVLFMLMMLVAMIIGLKRAAPKPPRESGGVGGKLAMIMPSALSGSVGAARFEEPEGPSYGDSTGSNVPLSAQAHEALVVAQGSGGRQPNISGAAEPTSSTEDQEREAQGGPDRTGEGAGEPPPEVR
jgi:hypothetical protein